MSSRNAWEIGILSPSSVLVESLYTRLVSSNAFVYSPLKSIKINLLFENPGAGLNLEKHSVYILANVLDFPLPVLPNMPM